MSDRFISKHGKLVSNRMDSSYMKKGCLVDVTVRHVLKATYRKYAQF
jgi:hypothetical protein